MDRPAVSVCIPMHNEAENVRTLIARLGPVLDRLSVPAEIVAVDDGSADDTLVRLAELRSAEPRLRFISLSRNFGKEVAIAAALRFASGDAVVVMDGDLQHPPELIEKLVAAWRQGFAMVIAERTDRKDDSLAYRAFARAFYRVFSAISDTPLPRNAGDFRLMDRKVVDALNAVSERSRFTKGLYSWVGFRTTTVPFDVAPRLHGRSAFSSRRLWRFALDGIVAFSTLPIRVWSYLGLLVSVFSIAYAVWLVIATLIVGADVPGYPSLMVAVIFFAGLQLIGMGLLGEYIGRIFTEVKQRPLFIVADAVGFDSDGTAAPVAVDRIGEIYIAH